MSSSPGEGFLVRMGQAWYSDDMNKKQILSGFFIALTACFAGISAPARAATLPPGNPFYFMQDGMRALRRTLTFSPAAKAFLEVRLVGERQDDIREVLAGHKDESVVRAAFSAYGDEVQALGDSMRGGSDERLSDAVAGLLAGHGRFFNSINPDISVPADILSEAKARLASLAIRAFGAVPAGAFRARFASAGASGGDAYRELTAAETLIGFQFEAERAGNAAFAREIKFAMEDLEVSFIGRMKGGDASLAGLASVPGDRLARLYVLEGVRARVGDIETKTSVGLLERQVLADMASGRQLGAGIAREAIVRAASEMPSGAKLADDAAYFADQANMFLMNNAYDLSLQNAVAAYVAASNALLEASATSDDLRAEVASLKARYDALRGIRPSFIEKRIGAIADMVGRSNGREALAAIREMKLVLAILGN